MLPQFWFGMAVHTDYPGVYHTVQDLLCHHRQYVAGIIIVDNAPATPSGDLVREFASKFRKVPVVYAPFPDVIGTAAVRDQVFKLAPAGAHVVVTDSHIQFVDGAVAALSRFYAAHPGCPDLVQGPMVYDSHEQLSTHFSPAWGAAMLGKWSTDTALFPPELVDEFGRPVAAKPWGEIPAQGLGAYACRKEAWLGFNPHFRGFGGEEWYIHDKFRRAGRKTWCVTGMKWVHRFQDTPKKGTPSRTTRPYPASYYDRARNYSLGAAEFGDVDRAVQTRNHFDQLLKPAEWARLAADVRQIYGESPVLDMLTASGTITTTENPAKALEAGTSAPPASAKPAKRGCQACAAKAGQVGKAPEAGNPRTIKDVEGWAALVGKNYAFSGPLRAAAKAAVSSGLADGKKSSLLVHSGGLGSTTLCAVVAARPEMVVTLDGLDPREEKAYEAATGKGTSVAASTSFDPVACDLAFFGPNTANLTAAVRSWEPKAAVIAVDASTPHKKEELLAALRVTPNLLVSTLSVDGFYVLYQAQNASPGRHFSRAVKFTLADLRSKMAGSKISLPQTAAGRFDTCLLCPTRRAVISDDGSAFAQCGDCLCWLDAVPKAEGGGPGKTWTATEECPQGKWAADPHGVAANDPRLAPIIAEKGPPVGLLSRVGSFLMNSTRKPAPRPDKSPSPAETLAEVPAEEPKKFLGPVAVVCQEGMVRSVALSRALQKRGVAAYHVGWRPSQPLGEAPYAPAAAVYVTDRVMLERLPPAARARAKVAQLGQDVWGNPSHPELVRLADHMASGILAELAR